MGGLEVGGPRDTAGAAEKKVRGAQVAGVGGGRTSRAKVVRWEQEQLVEEMEAVMGDRQEVTEEDVRDMVFLEQVGL